MGLGSPDELTFEHIYHRPEFGPACTYREFHPLVEPGDFLSGTVPSAYSADWEKAHAERF